jgi:hypothetical protein
MFAPSYKGLPLYFLRCFIKNLNPLKTNIILVILYLLPALSMQAQPCTPQGDETSYGTNDVWIGYVYDNINFTTYSGYVNEGTAGNPNFDESFTGDYTNYATNGCPVYTETFSVRYKLTKTFADGDYEFLVGADDGFRLSLDGGATWFINRWNDQSYTTEQASIHLNGTYNLVFEFYENGGGNRVSFNVQTTCVGTGNPATYGITNVWNGYVYDGTNFNLYKGMVTEGTATNPNFDESFGGDYVNYATGNCSVLTETYSVRYRLAKTFLNNSCLFTVGADDGYRLSLDGGATWVIDHWNDQGYNTSTYNANLNGTYFMVLEYYENGGGNRVSFDITFNLLPVKLISFSGERRNTANLLNWKVTAESNPDHFEIEKSSDGNSFITTGTVKGLPLTVDYTYTDPNPGTGISYYRLKMTDKDGQTTYSSIISITAAAQNKPDIFPTVLNNQRTVYIKTTAAIEKASLLVYDMSGKKVMAKAIPSIAAGQTVAVSLQQNTVLKGMYLVQLQSAGKLLLSKMIMAQ